VGMRASSEEAIYHISIYLSGQAGVLRSESAQNIIPIHACTYVSVSPVTD
jgi:hypothetical protein